jgi:phytoene synthase
MERFGVTPADLAAHTSSREFVDLMRHEAGVARAMLVEGGELHKRVDKRLRRDIVMFAGGGLAIIRAIDRVNYDVFRMRPELAKLDYLKLGWSAICGRLEV